MAFLIKLMTENRNLERQRSASEASADITPETMPNWLENAASNLLGPAISTRKPRASFERKWLEGFSDWHDLLDKTDAVSIATPTETHAEIACAFLENGIHVLVEKPIATRP